MALSTPPGRSGIGVIRISGPDSLRILHRITNSESSAPEPNYMMLRSLLDPFSGNALDQALVCFFKAPHSFTGEDVVEFHCHGSPPLLRQIVDTVLRLGARLANPGEFSLRAVMNGRLQLTEAEAIRDLIDAQTDAAAQQATRQLGGEISHRLQPVKEQLLKVIVRLESSLEFVEDDLPQLEQAEMDQALGKLRSELRALANTFAHGRLLHDGLTVALVGSPNAGKSSLFNTLLGHERAIVTEIPGTTRDTISEPIGIDGIPVRLIDTAGMRATTDQIESMGVERTRQVAADADLLVVVVDGSRPLTDEDQFVIRHAASKSHILAANKSDLPSFSAEAVAARGRDNDERASTVAVSALTEDGLAELRAAMLKPFVNGNGVAEGLMITNARHHDLLVRAAESIESSQHLIRERAPEEIVLVGLHNALRFLGEITGETTTEEILGQIFSTFCIGK
ncbi:MAG TPA: tRNA uridine-5-carboxymethylaminomethyl(34) synthesis GTPase MnmE [Pyrinomonadaceae bacterium]